MVRLFLSFLMFFLSTSVFGQIERKVTYDFTNPKKLNLPAVEDYDVNSETLTLGKVNMTFSRGELYFGVRYIRTDGNYYLEMNRGSKLILSSADNSIINKVTFNLENFGDLNVVNQNVGYWNSNSAIWTNKNSETVNEIAFKNNGDHSLIKSITVSYTEPSNILEPQVDQAQLNVASFKSLSLNFASEMTKVGNESLSLVGEKDTYPLTANVNNSTVVLASSESIDIDGTYTLDIPANYFKDANGYTNKALSYTIVVNTPKNILEYKSISPKIGEIDKLNSPIILTYGKTNLTSFSKELMMYKDGEEYSPVTIERSLENSTEVIVTFDIPQGITEKGEYTIQVPEGTIYDNMLKTYNPAFTISYKVGYKPAPVDSEIMKLAKKELSKNGVGYPSANSSSRVVLTELVSAQPVPSDEDLQNAIDDFYKETNVELPTVGNWYIISNVNVAGKTLYISAKNNVLSVTENEKEATAFEAVEPMLFKTLKGKYLFTKSIEDNADNKTLNLAKLSVENVDAQKLLGYLSMYGYFETDKGIVYNAFASVDFENNEISTSDHDSAPLFEEKYSGAFAFTQTIKPSDEPENVDMHCIASPTTLTDGNSALTLTFDEVDNIDITDKAKVSLLSEDGDEIQSLSLHSDSKKANILTVNVGDLPNAKYSIKIAKGSLTYTENGTVYSNNEMEVAFEVKKTSVTPPAPSEEFNYSYSGILYYPTGDYIQDVDLNQFTIGNAHYNYPLKPQGLIVDESKKVLLMQLDLGKVIGSGHFKKIDSMPTDPDSPEAYQIVMDTPIKAGDLKKDIYTFVIPEATFGDYNFGKYLEDKTSILASKCYVNKEFRMPFSVDNDKATGIKDITTDTNRPTVIYDLMGRRVQNMSRPGIYIVNGKKVVKK